MTVGESILDLARWAPSGDNTQPWRFELLTDDEVVVHGYDTRATCVYDLDGRASQLSHGALLETIALAATRFGRRASIRADANSTEQHRIWRIAFERDDGVREHPLVAQIAERTVQRKPMAVAPLTTEQKSALIDAARPFGVAWLETPHDRRRMAWLSLRSAHIRLTTPEAFAVHKAVIAFHATTSEDRLPDGALGADPLLLATMRWAMASWERVQRLNRYAAGTVMPRVALDLVPGLRCSAHFALFAQRPPASADDVTEAGRAVQRFWLEATRHGLQMQPNYTPLVFARYAREQRAFTTVAAARRRAEEIERRLRDVLAPSDAQNAVFLGRIGPAKPVGGRSLRLPLARLVVRDAPASLG